MLRRLLMVSPSLPPYRPYWQEKRDSYLQNITKENWKTSPPNQGSGMGEGRKRGARVVSDDGRYSTQKSIKPRRGTTVMSPRLWVPHHTLSKEPVFCKTQQCAPKMLSPQARRSSTVSDMSSFTYCVIHMSFARTLKARFNNSL